MKCEKRTLPLTCPERYQFRHVFQVFSFQFSGISFIELNSTFFHKIDLIPYILVCVCVFIKIFSILQSFAQIRNKFPLFTL